MSLEDPESPARAETVDVTILGVHVKSAGYPNVTFRLHDLGRSSRLRLREINFPFRGKSPPKNGRPYFWKPLRLLWSAMRLAYAHVHVLLAYLGRGRPRRLYIPYPSVFVLFFLSLLPKSWRPHHVVADCFISLYDTVVTDRNLAAGGSWAARALRSAESRAYRTADTIIVDTDLNAAYFAETFGLAPSKILVLPLSIDAGNFREAPYQPRTGSCTVLFVGTFVPLQGVDVIAHATIALESRQDIRFRIVGSGQTADAVRRIYANRQPGNVEWITRWMDGEELASEIRNADICLGIFGTGPKTQRVWPLKNYAYMAIGRPLITGDTQQARRMLQQADAAPFAVVPPGDPGALASSIIELADNPGRRKLYAENARLFYRKNLSSFAAAERIVRQFTDTRAVAPLSPRQASRS